MNNLFELIENIIEEEKLIKMILSNKRKKSLEYNKVYVRPVELKGEYMYHFEFFFDKKVTHLNLSKTMAKEKIAELLEVSFKQAGIFTIDSDITVLASKIANPRIITKPATMKPQVLNHNDKKNYIIEENKPCDFLIELGVMKPSGEVIQKHYSKFRQINRYLEIIDDVFPYLPQDRTIKIIDFGCGKAYLTFAIYYYLKKLKNLNVEIIGLDLKKDVIDFCNDVAIKLGYDELKYLVGDIAEYENDYADMVVTLHACDTATDFALINAVKWNTKVILSVPCCQHELFSQIDNDIHEPMLKHGILKDRLTEYLTDGLRGLKLESRGYDVAMVEFTSLEHTSKNILIKAIKIGTSDSSSALKANEEYETLKDFYKVNPTIDSL